MKYTLAMFGTSIETWLLLQTRLPIELSTAYNKKIIVQFWNYSQIQFQKSIFF